MNNIYPLAILLLLCTSCGNNGSSYKYYEKNITDWSAYTNALGQYDIQLENTILLVLKGSECSPSISELKWWNNFHTRNSKLNVQLIILEKYETSFKAFLEYEEIQIPALRDSSGILFDHDLIPRTPMKVFIDANGDVKKLASIGKKIDPNQDMFIKSLNK